MEIVRYLSADGRVKFYTGVPTSILLLSIYRQVSKYVSVSSWSTLCKFQELCLVLVCLNLTEQDLAHRFGSAQ